MFAGLLVAALIGGVPLPLPAPQQPVLLPNVGATADRLRVSVLPTGASATDTEAVAVGIAGGGDATSVVVDQRIALSGHGDYVVVERGPARRAQVLGDGDPPTLKAGAVLYAGFLPPTGRLLSARLTLDPNYERARLPMRVSLSFLPVGSRVSEAVGAGGLLPGPGTLTISLVNATGTLTTVDTGDAPASGLAGPLDSLRTAASHPGPRPPVAGGGLPTELAGASDVTEAATQVTAPLRVAGSVSLKGADGKPDPAAVLSGDGVTPTPGGGRVAGVLADGASFALAVPAAGRLAIDLSATPALDERTLVPPAGSPTWAAWAAGHPGASARRAAVDTLELAAAQSAQIRQISPYLTTGLVGQVTTTFDYRIAPAAAPAAAVADPLRRRDGVLVLFGVGVALVAVNLELLRRRL